MAYSISNESVKGSSLIVLVGDWNLEWSVLGS